MKPRGSDGGYYVIFAERMIQHPAVKAEYASDFSFLFAGQEDFYGHSASKPRF